MKIGRLDLFASLIILIIAGIFVLDVFLTPGRPASFDAPFHITNIAQFALALKDGDFPVIWTDGVANYGLPMSIVAHQLTNYLGAIITLVDNDPLFAYNLLSFIGIFLSSLFYYFFLRIYFLPVPAFLGTYLFTFSSYKIINFYIRGAMPEIFSGIFLPLLLIGFYMFIKQKDIRGFFLIIVATFLLTINHPMMLLIYSFVFFPYLAFLLLTKQNSLDFSALKKLTDLKKFFGAMIALVVGIGMGGYYIVPLNLEIKYFYYGLIKNHLNPNSYLGIKDFFSSNWQYFTANEIYTRGHIIQLGVIEALGIVVGVGLLLWKHVIKKEKSVGIFEFAVIVSLLLVFFTSSFVNFLYTNISILSNIQFPWRMLSALLFLSPIIYAYVFTKLKKSVFAFGFIIVVSLFTFPQLYGKNYVNFPTSTYYFTPYNTHSVLMNTIWSGKTEEYPIKRNKPEIIEGKGKIIEEVEKNSSRKYQIEAVTPVRMADYTFYFPGWKVMVDGQNVPIEFQDPKFRGVITYTVPQGRHTVFLVFTDTKIRFLGKIVSLGFIILFSLFLLFRKRLSFLFLNT